MPTRSWRDSPAEPAPSDSVADVDDVFGGCVDLEQLVEVSDRAARPREETVSVCENLVCRNRELIHQCLTFPRDTQSETGRFRGS